MSDETNEKDDTIKSVTEYVPKTRRRRQTHTPKSKRNQERQEEAPPTTAQVREWITAGALAAGQKVYRELADNHRLTFEMQEAAFMAVATKLHERLCVLEMQAGIFSPDIASLRAELEAAVVAFQNGPAVDDEQADPTVQ